MVSNIVILYIQHYSSGGAGFLYWERKTEFATRKCVGGDTQAMDRETSME